MKKIILLLLFTLIIIGCVNKENDENYSFQLLQNEGGMADYNPIKSDYEHGEEISIDAVANEIYEFSHWENEEGDILNRVLIN